MALNPIIITAVLALLASTILGAPTTTQLYKRSDSSNYVYTPSPPTPTPATTTTGTSTGSASTPAVGTCVSSSALSTTTSCAMPTVSPYVDVLYPNIMFNADCHMINLCNAEDFAGNCTSVPIYVNGPDTDSCDYLGLIGSCITFPDRLDPEFETFSEFYGPLLLTSSVRTGNSISCRGFSEPYCLGSNFTVIDGGDITDSTKSLGIDIAMLSFHCWSQDAAEPTWGQTALDASPAPMTISVSASKGAAPSLQASLQNDFNPFIDEIMFCKDYQKTECSVFNSSGSCMTLREDGINPWWVASQYGHECSIYNGGDCTGDELGHISSPEPLSFNAMVDGSITDWSFKCWVPQCSGFLSNTAKYSSCTSPLSWPAGPVTTTLIPIPVITSSYATWSGSGSSPSTLPSGTSTSPSTPLGVVSPTTTPPPSTTTNTQCTSTSGVTITNLYTVDGVLSSSLTYSTATLC